MASGKRQPSKQKRTNQNRQQRAARQARATAASTARPTASGSSASSARGGLLGRLRGAGASARPAAARPAGGGGGRLDRLAGSPLADPSLRPPGYRAALTGLLAAAAAVVVTIFLHTPVDADGELYTKPSIAAEWAATALQAAQDAPDADGREVVRGIDDWMPERGSERLAVAYFPLSLAALLPLVASYLCFRAVQQRRGAKVVTRTMYATLLGAFLATSLLQFFLPTVIAVSIAGFQVRKAEMERARAAAEAAGEGDAGRGTGDDVIDAEVIDEPGDADVDDEPGDAEPDVVGDDPRRG